MTKKQPTREKLLDVAFEEIYIHGYHATSIDTILKKSGIPKGSMYHHFTSKKELVLTMITERLFPKMDMFFSYEKKEEKSVIDSIRDTFLVVSKNKMLVTYGCPLYRLMVEMSAADKAFDTILVNKANEMKEGIVSLLEKGKESGELSPILECDIFSSFMLSATWGILSISPSLSSAKNFLQQSHYILKELESYKID